MIGRATAVKLAKQDFDILIHTGGKSLEEAKKTSEMISELDKNSFPEFLHKNHRIY